MGVRDFLEKAQRLNRIPNALLLYGEEGVGKSTLALELSRGILCGKPWGCNNCKSCKSFNSFLNKLKGGSLKEISYLSEEGKFLYLMGEHPDFILLIPDGATLKIEQVRAMEEFLDLRPVLSKKKVVLIEKGERMEPPSQNALLKTLEEPPFNSTIIITTSRRENLLKTIQSRCFNLYVEPLKVEKVKEIAKVSQEVAELSGGSVSRAKLLKEREEVLHLAKNFLNSEPFKRYEILKAVEGKDLEDRELFLYLLELFTLKSLKEGGEDYEEALNLLNRIGENLSALKRGVKLSLSLFP